MKEKKSTKRKVGSAFLIVALIYLFSPADIIPDVIPILGHIDDILSLVIGLSVFGITRIGE